MIQHRTNIRTVRALGISLLLLGSLAVGGCACTGNSDLRDLGALLGCSHRPPVRRAATPCDPCYGFHPTCWHAWPECCAGLPPGGGKPLGAGAGGAGTEAPPAGRAADLEVVPTPPQEPRAINLPPPPREGPSEVKEPAAPPLPEDGLKAPLPDKTDTPPEKDAKTGEPHALQGAKPRQGMARHDSRVLEGGDLEGAKELVALRQLISPPASRASLPGVPAAASLADEKPPRGEEAVFPRFSYYETLLDYSGDEDPGIVSSVAMYFGRDSLDP